MNIGRVGRRALLRGGLGAAAGVVALWVWSAVPVHPTGRDGTELALALPQRNLTVWTGRSYATVLLSHTDRAVVLINAGSDAAGTAVLTGLRALGRTAADVRLVLLTDGHFAHRAAAAQFPAAQIVCGEDASVAVLRGAQPAAPGMRLWQRLLPRPPAPPEVQTVLAGTCLQAGDIEVEAIGLAGHAPGSMGYRVGEVAWVGEALLPQGNAVALRSWLWSDRPAHARLAMRRLRRAGVKQVSCSQGAALRPLGDLGLF